MCRNKSDRETLIRALKRIVTPPETIQGQAAWIPYNPAAYNERIVKYLQSVACDVLDKVGR